MVFDTKVTIDGTDVTNYVIEYKVIDTVKDITPANLTLNRSILNIIELEKDQEIIITRGDVTATDYTIFKGNVSSIVKDGGDRVFIEAFDKLWLLSRQTITISYDINIDDEAGIVSAIASDLITRGGLTPDVEDSGSATKIDKYIIRSDNILDHLQELADLIDYWVYYDPQTDTVKFKSRGFETFNTTLEVGVNLLEIPRWNYDYTKISNDITLTGDRQEIETDEGFASSVTSLTLANKPESVKVKIGDTLLSGGITDQDSTFDYSVDKENKKINFSTATSGSGTVSYSFNRPVKVRKKNAISIKKYGTYAVHKTIDTIQTTTDAENKINEILTKFPDPIVSVGGLKINNVYGGKAGQKVRVIDSVNDEDRIVNIRRYVYNFPITLDQIDVDDEPIYDDYIMMNAFRKRIERLERRNEAAGDLINQFISFFRTFKPRRRFGKIQKDFASGTGFILSHPDFAILGTSQLGTPYHGTTETVKLIQGDNTYYEDLRDTEFIDSGSTDAVVTTSGTNPSIANITFSTGSVFQTKAIDIGTTLSSWRFDVGSASGSYKYEGSNDGKTNWETLSTGEVLSVTNSGTSTYLRITEESSGGTIENITDDYGEVTSPAIKFILNT